LLNFYMGLVPEVGTGLGYIGKREGNIAGLGWLTINDGFLAPCVFEQFNEAAQRDRLRFAEVENLRRNSTQRRKAAKEDG
jgi:hypothetical protein